MSQEINFLAVQQVFKRFVSQPASEDIKACLAFAADREKKLFMASLSHICTRRLPQTRKQFSSKLSRLSNCFGQLNLILTKCSKFQAL